MDGSVLGLVEMALVFGIVVGWGAWELYQLRRLRQQREALERREREAPGAEPPA